MPITRRALLSTTPALIGSAPAGSPVAFHFSLSHGDGRTTDFRAMAPPARGRWGVVLFSHGANSSNSDYDRLWSAWAQRGYLVVGPNHIDSGPVDAQRKVSRSELWSSRVADAALPLQQPARLDAFARRHGTSLDWRRVAAAGHSFGAVVAQSLAGARLIAPGASTAQSRPEQKVAACLAFSPPGPRPGFVPEDAWSTVAVPTLLQTGDIDVLPGFVDDWRLRLAGFASAADRWTLIGHGVDHYFGGLICRLRPGEPAKASLPALQETASLSADFLDAYLRRSPGALRRLESRAARGDDGVMMVAKA